MSESAHQHISEALAIIVVSYNVRDLLAACLRATLSGLERSGYQLAPTTDHAARSTQHAARIIVVDNASSDGSAAMVAAEFPQVRLVASPVNLGFAGGNNLALRMLGLGGAGEQGGVEVWGSGSEGVRERSSGGAEEQRGERVRNTQHATRNTQYILLLNPDAEPVGDAIGQMARFLEEHPQVGGVGAQLRYPDGAFQHGAFRFPGLLQLWFDLFPPRPRRLLDSRLNGRYPRSLFEAGRPFPIDFALGAALMVRREAIAAAGLLDEGYFMYAEEVDWCWRIQRAGWPFYCVPSAVVIHHGGASTQQFRARSFVNLWRSRLRLYGRFYGPVRRRLAAVIVRLGLWVERRRAQASAARGDLTAAELAERLAAVREVEALLATGHTAVETVG